MAKRPTVNTLTNTASPTYLTQLNQNFSNIQAQFDNTLSLDGSLPNAMNADLDLNDFDLINAGTVNADNLVVAGTNLNSVVGQAAASATAAATSASAAAASATTASAYTPAYFDNVAALLADTRAWPTGQILNTREEGFAYEVAASGASDQDLTTAGGVKLYVLANDVVIFAQFAPVSGSTNQSTLAQKAADRAKALGARLHFGALSGSTTYTFANVDIAGLTVTFDPDVTISPPAANSTQWCFVAVGTAGGRITKPTKLIGPRTVGHSTAKGLCKFEYCNEPYVGDVISTGYSTSGVANIIVWMLECLNPVVDGGNIVGAEKGVSFESCTNPVCHNLTGSSFYNDGIIFYTNPSGTLTTNAKSTGNVISGFAISNLGGRGGIHFYGCDGAVSVGDTVSNDSSQTQDDTGGIRFRDCRDFSAVGYDVTQCRSSVLVNHVNDYLAITQSFGAIGPGSINNFRKFGVIIASATSITCSVSGAKISNGPDIASVPNSAGISHGGIGSVSGCSLQDMRCRGVTISGKVSVSGNNFLRAGKGASSVPSVLIDGDAVVSGNYFSDDAGSPIATMAIRVPSGGSAVIGPNNFGVGITDFNELSSGSTLKGDSIVRYKFGGAPVFTGVTIATSGLKIATNSSGVPYAYYSGAWNTI